MQIDISTAIAVVSTVFAIFFGIRNLTRSKTTDDKADATQMATMIVKIDAVGTTVNEIKSDMREFKSEQQFLRDKIIEIEASVKSAHKRIDGLEDTAHE
jgi:hypothetical protein